MLTRRSALRIGPAIAGIIAGFLITLAVLAIVDGPTRKSRPPAPAATMTATHHATRRRRIEKPPSVSRMVGQMIMAGMVGTMPGTSLLDAVRAGQIGGVIVYGDNVTPSLPEALALLQRAAREGGNPPLLVSVDQEGGDVRRFTAAPPLPPRTMRTETEAFQQGALTGAFLRAQHVNVDLAPVADVTSSNAAFEVRQGRGFSGTPVQVAALATSFASGLQSQGVAATAKHFPGIGSLTLDTDGQLGYVSLSRSSLVRELLPFHSLIAAGVDLVMTANARYPAFDPSGAPASLSRVITGGLLRTELHFRGAVITDALDSPSDLGGDVSQRAIRAALAGADIVLFAPEADGQIAYHALVTAASDGTVSPSIIKRAYRAVLALKRRVATA